MSNSEVGWNPYTQPSATFLASILLAIAIILGYLGFSRLSLGLKPRRPGKVVGGFMIVVWGLSGVTLLTFYGVIQSLTKTGSVFPPSPIAPVTCSLIVIMFIAITYMTRGHGLKMALGNAFLGSAAAPMIFEFPFDIIVGLRGATPVLSLLLLSPMFLVEISTISLLLLSPLFQITKLTLFSLGAMFAVFSVWAFFGFSFPSNPISFTLNVISKILSFATAITLFLNQNKFYQKLSSRTRL